MKAISINAYEIENNDGETMVFMTPKEFDFIKKQNDFKDKEIERLNNIINKAIEYIEEKMELSKECPKELLKVLKGSDKE